MTEPQLGLIYDRVRLEEKAIMRAARKRGLRINSIDAKKICLDLTTKDSREFGHVVIQRCVSYFRGLHLAFVLKEMNIPTINSFDTSQICGDKLFATLAFIKEKIPTPRTFLAFTPEEAIKAAENLGYPSVLKPVIGSWGRLIAPLKDRESAEAILEHREQLSSPIFHIYYVQEMVTRPPRDIRAVVVGEEVVAAMHRHAASNDWRTNLARGGKAVRLEITPEFEELALEAAKAVGGGVLGVDMMEGPNGLLVHEVNSTVEFKGLSHVTDVDIAGKIVEYAIGLVKK